MAEKPVICDTRPMAVDLEPGTYWWCACGRSSHPPFCDGSHKGSGIQPVKHEASEAGRVWFCQCKHTGNAPLCDGAHKNLMDT